MINKLPAPLADSVEEVVYEVIGACIVVHRELGPGLLEAVYHRAVAIELDARGISYASEVSIPITFKDQILCHHRLDLVVADAVVVELKAVERIAPVHVAQALSYLKVSRLRVALLINFNVAALKSGIRRIVL